jgi:MIP family channel proteins
VAYPLQFFGDMNQADVEKASLFGTDASRSEEKARPRPGFERCLGAELLGVFILTLADAGTTMIHALTREGEYTARALVPGLTVAALIYSLGGISGAHINPVATLAFALRGVFSWRKLPLYIGAQLFGSCLAALWLHWLFGPIKFLGANEPHTALPTAFGMEMTLTFILVIVILATATRHQNLGPEAAIAVGATVALCNMVGKPLTGASMNPARSFGPALVSGHLGDLWLYCTAPLLGAVLAVVVTRLIHGPAKPEEIEAAQGEKSPG